MRCLKITAELIQHIYVYIIYCYYFEIIQQEMMNAVDVVEITSLNLPLLPQSGTNPYGVPLIRTVCH